MVIWNLKFKNRAKKDSTALASAHLKDRAERLLNVIKERPLEPPPEFEKLIGDLKGYYSRRINRQHRIVYNVNSKDKCITIFSMYSHYGE